jgi:hypothetical protein
MTPSLASFRTTGHGGSGATTEDSNPDVLWGYRGSAVEECLGRNDVLSARALRALADGERHGLAFAHGVEWRTRARGLMKEIFGAVRRGDEAEAFVRDALDRTFGRHLYPLEEVAEIGRVTSVTHQPRIEAAGPWPGSPA